MNNRNEKESHKKREEKINGNIHFSPFTKPSLLSRKLKNRKKKKQRN